MNLILDLYGLPAGEHPLRYVRRLGIEYSIAVPQSMADQWHLWNCKNVPEPLPAAFRVITLPPDKYVGGGLSREDADRLNRETALGSPKAAP